MASREHLSFVLRGPMVASSARGELQFWREAPTHGAHGHLAHRHWAGRVTSERVAYDLNLASGQLRQPS
jgi:hypothetical protein